MYIMFDVQTYFWIMYLYDPKVSLKINVGHRDLRLNLDAYMMYKLVDYDLKTK